MNTTISKQHPIAYLCAEYGVATELPIYAGGLGVLAGDTVKAAADMAAPFVAVGLLYRGHGVVQHLSPDGLQTEGDYYFDPIENGLDHVYLNEEPLFVKVHLTELDVWLRVWKKEMGNGVILYLLDSETDQNELVERDITQVLYSGTQENLIKQQLILGIGGVKLLAKLGVTPSVYHINEGRPAFAHWQLIRMFMDDHGMTYDEARTAAIEKTVYTNHTLVAAGNQSYSPELIKMYSAYYADKMGISNDILIADGIDENDQFSITQFALNTSRRANGVSSLHTNLSKKTWPQYSWVNVTNGVHRDTWQSSSLLASITSDMQLWHEHLSLKKQTMQFIQKQTGFGYDENKLVLGWARRLAGYKQLPLLFADLARLRAILTHTDRPIQLLISGKAHMGDTMGKQMLQEIIGYFSNELADSALFVPNYNIEVAQHLNRGVDVWLNTPELGMEACGTSGMKATLNGIPNCTVADGWAEEIAWDGTQGWELDSTRISDHLYELLENTIAPLYYQRDVNDVPHGWIAVMKNAMQLGEKYTAERMLNEYFDKLYSNEE